MIEGSGSGSVPLTKESGSKRPRNVRIRIRINNTAFGNTVPYIGIGIVMGCLSCLRPLVLSFLLVVSIVYYPFVEKICIDLVFVVLLLQLQFYVLVVVWSSFLPALWNHNYVLRFRFLFRFRLLKSYGSGSYFWKVTVPFPVQAPYLDYKKQIFQKIFWNFFAFLDGKLLNKEKVYKFQEIYCNMWMKNC